MINNRGFTRTVDFADAPEAHGTPSAKFTAGFTLIEMLVAVLLLTLAIGGPLTISSKALIVALVAKDQTTAFFLAQDAVEYVRYARDTNSFAGGDWLAGAINLGVCTSSGGTNICHINSITSEVTACSGTCNRLNYNSGTNEFTYQTGTGITPTPFTRTVRITSPYNGAVQEAVLAVAVSWSDIGGVTRTITVTETLFDWQ